MNPFVSPSEWAAHARAIALLQDGGVPFVVGGAYAMFHYTGVVRYTKDLDLFLPRAEEGRARELLSDAGWATRVHEPAWLSKAFHGDTLVDLIHGSGNGLIEVDGAWVERGVSARVLGVPTRLVAPEEMLRVSDQLASLVPALMLTEWDVMTNGDEELQADYLRDTLIAAYSHSAYRGFLMWVWWEGAGWRPEAALFRRDGSEKPNGRVWRELVSERWRTDTSTTADTAGLARFRGHAGLYDLTIEHEGRTATVQHVLPRTAPQGPTTVTIRWDAPP
jgi:hypothetical protein